jgi:anaerobic selenocysteine-containing dehydrogenase
VVFAEVSAKCFGGIALAEIGESAVLPPRAAVSKPAAAKRGRPAPTRAKSLRLVAYRPLFSGIAVERTPELAFQRPERDVWLSPEDARKRKIRNGAAVTVSSNGTSVELRARIARDLMPGAVRIAEDHAAGLHAVVEVKA